jgi:Flp pilus assembly protein TadD
MDSAPLPSPARRARRSVLLLALTVLATGTGWGGYLWYRGRSAPAPKVPPPAAMRFLNTDLSVRYVGSQRCGECHPAETANYAQHPMGRSVSSADRPLPAQLQARPTFEASGLSYAVERKSAHVFHREFVAGGGSAPPVEIVAEAAFAIGSGRQGQSFLIERKGRLFQSPISWYVQAKSWNLSPSYDRQNQHFSRTIGELCLFCHVNEARIEPETINRFGPTPLRLEPIGCERCHGPGELHVAARERGDPVDRPDRTIVNPRHLPPARREAVCQQCHLQGETRIVRAGKSPWHYRPGLPLEDYLTVFVRPPDRAESGKAVSHVEQMFVSRCYRASAGEMDCISCHDPHVLPSENDRVAWYRGRCLNCHRQRGCALPENERRQHNAADSCIDCHMARGNNSNIAHTSISDHRIVRHPFADAAADDRSEMNFVPFHSSLLGGDSVSRRDLGLALSEMAERSQAGPQRRSFAHQAVALLNPAVRRAPEDVAAREALGQALWRAEQPREALTVLDRLLQQTPRRESALAAAALVALELGEAERGIAYWRTLREINPYGWQQHAYFAQALALRKKWTEAAVACTQALRLHPFERRTRMLLIDCLVHAGERQRARAEFEKLLALRPPEPDKLKKWFDELMNAATRSP